MQSVSKLVRGMFLSGTFLKADLTCLCCLDMTTGLVSLNLSFGDVLFKCELPQR